MRTTIAELHLSNERSFAQIGQIIMRSAQLREDLAETGENFSVGPVFAEAIGRARRMLLETARQIQPAFSPLGSEASGRDLDEVARHYTMQAERDVHEGVASLLAPQTKGDADVDGTRN